MDTGNIPWAKISSIAILAAVLGLWHLVCPQSAGGEAPKLQYDEYYHDAWRLLKNNSLYDDKVATLCGWEHKYDGQLDSQQAADTAIATMVESLGDDYTYFRNAQATALSVQQNKEHGVVALIMLPENIAWIKLRSFASEHTAQEMRDALLSADSCDGYILDLRDNKGGNIYEAFEAAAMFIDKGAFARLEGRLDGSPYSEQLNVTPTHLRLMSNNLYWDEPRTANLTGGKPVVVLVNKKTRSAAEMLAGALRDNRRCILIGERTYGKGVVQKIFPLSDGSSLKIVIARNYLPSGVNVHNVGLMPDLLTNGGEDELIAARKVLRHQLALKHRLGEQLSMR